MDRDRKICVGMIAGAHGVRGLVRLRSFTENPESIKSYKPLTDESGERVFAVTIQSASKDDFIASVEGVKSKEAADGLRGVKLYIARTALPKTRKREFYETDLIGLMAQDEEGKDFGKVLAVHNYGGGPFLEIGKTKAGQFMLPFTIEHVPDVDVEAGRVTINPPKGWL